MIREMTYDSKCHDLAKVFLEDDGIATPELTHSLAKLIQSVIEAFIEYDPDVVAHRELVRISKRR